jgi:hypothetical protein
MCSLLMADNWHMTGAEAASVGGFVPFCKLISQLLIRL